MQILPVKGWGVGGGGAPQISTPSWPERKMRGVVGVEGTVILVIILPHIKISEIHNFFTLQLQWERYHAAAY